MILGAYWSARQESADAATDRVVAFLTSVAQIDQGLATWRAKGRSEAAAGRNSPIALNRAALSSHMKRNRADDRERTIIEDLGWSIDLWNGEDVSFSCAIGMYAPRLSNCVLLDFGPPASGPPEHEQEAHLASMIRIFDPDRAVATNDAVLDRVGAKFASEAGWLMYERGGVLRSRPEFRP